MNALNSGLIKDICAAAEAFEKDEGIGAMVLTGSERAFAGEHVRKDNVGRCQGKVRFRQLCLLLIVFSWSALLVFGYMVDAPL